MAGYDDPFPTLQVTLFGHVRVASGGESFYARFTNHRLLVFAMLVTQQQDVFDREQLAFTLWPDLTEAEARSNLRRQIYNLQQSLPQSKARWFRADARTIAWAAVGRTEVDVNEFDRLRTSPVPRSALEHYGGDFLPCVDHEWVTAHRRTLREQAMTILWDVVRDAWSTGDMSACKEYAEQLLTLDPWREDVLRYCISARCRGGDRAGAFAAYRRFQGRLYTELGVAPMPETERCVELLRRGEVPTVSPPSPSLAAIDRRGQRSASPAACSIAARR